MPNKKETYEELVAKLKVVEAENLFLSTQIEEFQLVTKIFEAIYNFEEEKEFWPHILEHIGILLNYELAVLFQIKSGEIIKEESYFLSYDENVKVDFMFQYEFLSWIYDDVEVVLNDGDYTFTIEDEEVNIDKIILLPVLKNHKEKYFLLLGPVHDEIELENQIEILKKIEAFLSAKIENVYYQHKLEQRNEELIQTLDHLKQTQAQLIDYEKMASVGTLASGLSHEMNNPLNFIQSGVAALEELIAESNAKNLKEIHEILDVIKNGVERTSKIIISMNQFNRQSEAMDDKINIDESIDACLNVLNFSFKEDRIQIEKNYGKKVPALIGNQSKINQLFLNVLLNAKEAIQNKGIISISTRVNKDFITIVIKDNGCGIPDKILPRITEAFFTTKDVGKGTGLGLYISYQVVKTHKGNLIFNSKLGRGTKVTIELPFVKL